MKDNSICLWNPILRIIPSSIFTQKTISHSWTRINVASYSNSTFQPPTSLLAKHSNPTCLKINRNVGTLKNTVMLGTEKNINILSEV
jgi:hypothetical protein